MYIGIQYLPLKISWESYGSSYLSNDPATPPISSNYLHSLFSNQISPKELCQIFSMARTRKYNLLAETCLDSSLSMNCRKSPFHIPLPFSSSTSSPEYNFNEPNRDQSTGRSRSFHYIPPLLYSKTLEDQLLHLLPLSFKLSHDDDYLGGFRSSESRVYSASSMAGDKINVLRPLLGFSQVMNTFLLNILLNYYYYYYLLD